jgi:hypothetical protein
MCTNLMCVPSAQRWHGTPHSSGYGSLNKKAGDTLLRAGQREPVRH